MAWSSRQVFGLEVVLTDHLPRLLGEAQWTSGPLVPLTAARQPRILTGVPAPTRAGTLAGAAAGRAPYTTTRRASTAAGHGNASGAPSSTQNSGAGPSVIWRCQTAACPSPSAARNAS
jgi:hypothetical protein